MNEILKCIEIAKVYKIRSLKKRIYELYTSDFLCDFEWLKSFSGKLAQVIITPIYYVVAKLFNTIEVINIAIKMLIIKFGTIKLTEDKSFYTLWNQYGLDSKFQYEDRMDTL